MSDTPDTTTRHEYTDAEILEAWSKSGPSIMGEPTMLARFRAFLAALPERPQAAEIAALKAALAESEKQFQDKVYEIARLLDERDKAQGILKACLSVMPFGNLETHTFENLPGRIADLASEIASLSFENERIESELAALRQPILADDGRSLGQVAMKASFDADTDGLTVDECYEAAAQAVAAVVLAHAVRRMEAVPVKEIARPYETAAQFHASECGLEAVRARLLAAAKGEGQVQPVVVNEPPKSEEQPYLFGESEKQDPYARMKAYAKAGARIRTHDMEWARDANWTWCLRPESYFVHPDDLHMVPEYAPQAEPAQSQQEPAQPWTPDNAKAYEDFQAELRETWAAQPWTPAVGDTVRSIPEMALGGQMYWRDLAIQLARVWWKCHNIGASLQHGDLDKDIAFSIVCERHGGKVFHGDTPENAWHKAEEWMLSPDRENFPAACLTPAKEGQP